MGSASQRADIITSEDVSRLLGKRKRNCSKRDNGRGLLIAGSAGFSGAAVMAGCAALRAGIGTLKVLVPWPSGDSFAAVPEIMCLRYPGEDWDDAAAEYAAAYIGEATALGIGPGLGRGGGREALLRAVLSCRKPTVVDADALFALSRIEDKRAVLHENAVLTPHMGEMERLTGIPAAIIAASQADIAAEYAAKWGCTVLLKGAESCIASPDGNIAKNITGNPGLAKGGSGDVLTGITLAMLGQGLVAYDAARAAAYILGASADDAVKLLCERMLMARDVTDMIERTIEKTI